MFRIEYLKLTEHPQLGDIELFLSDIEEINNFTKPYTSVIIGPNGTGKSFILRTISDILMQFNMFKTSGIKTTNLPYNIHLRYIVDNISYEIISGFSVLHKNKTRRDYLFYKGRPFLYNKEIVIFNKDQDIYQIEFKDLKFPNYVIANSVLQTDRFLFRNSQPDDFYQYLGARSTRSTSSTKSSSRKTIKYLFNANSSNTEFKNNLKELLDFLGFEKSLKINYTTKINKLFFSGELTDDNFKRYFEEWWLDDFAFSKRSKDNPLWSVPHYNNNFRDNKSKITDTKNYLNYIAKNKLTNKARSSSKVLSIDLFDTNLNEKEFEIIRQLEQLDIINIDGIIINKNNSTLSLNDISSGEFHLIISMIGIFSKIENNSLVLIDEPEISLHPNWQMQYITFLKNVFSKYPSCHFILTSHSHFIVSDLEGKSSSVTALSRDDETGKIKSMLLIADTYCWSAEEVLYSVFNVRSTRNTFLEYDLTKLISLINNNSNNYDEIGKILNKFSSLVINEGDPLNIIIEKAKKYIKNA